MLFWERDKKVEENNEDVEEFYALFSKEKTQGVFEEEIIIFKATENKKYNVKGAEEGIIGSFDTLEEAKFLAERYWANYEVMSFEDVDARESERVLEAVKEYVSNVERYKSARYHLDSLEKTDEEKELMEKVVEAAIVADKFETGQFDLDEAVKALIDYRENT